MLALRKTAPRRGLELCDAAAPVLPGPGEVLLDVTAVGVCGTDLHIEAWTGNYHFMAAALPVTIGHEFSARVAAVGADVAELARGDRVTVMPSVTCGSCAACTTGHAEACRSRTGIGITRAGAFAPRVVAPARNCIRVPPAVDDELAALCEPLTVGAEAVRTGEVSPAHRVLVLGPGTIGQAIALAARHAGACEIVVAGRHDAQRLATVRTLGFERVVDVAEGTLQDALARAGESAPFHRVFEATGAPEVVPDALLALAPGGVLVISGIHERPATVDLTRVVRDTLQIRGAYRASRATWADVIARLATAGDAYRPMITHRLPLARALDGFAIAHAREASKVMVFPQA